MSREVRRVPANWKHPQAKMYGRLQYVGLNDNYVEAVADWEKDKSAWESGERPSYWTKGEDSEVFEEYNSDKPDSKEYMPDWPESEKTHFQMYETVSEGKPISPPFATIEQLAQWLANTGAYAGGINNTATYEQWLATCKAGWAPSMVSFNGGPWVSGVEGFHSK